MKTMGNRKTQPNQINRSVFLFHRYGTLRQGSKILGTSQEARAIGKAMAHKVAKKLRLKLEV